MRARIKETDLSVPERLDGWLYYHRTEAGAQYPIYCRRPAELPEGDGGGGAARPQPAGRGPRLLPAGRVRGEPRPPAAGLVGGHERRGVVHPVREGARHRRAAGGDDQQRARPAWRGPTTAGPCSTSCSTRRAALPSLPPPSGRQSRRPTRWSTSRPTSRSSSTSAAPGATRYLLLDMRATRPRRCGTRAPTGPRSAFRVIEPRRPGIEYSVTHHGDRFFITTNDGAPNFRLVSAPVSDPVARALDRGAAPPPRREGGLDRRVPATTWWSTSARRGCGRSGSSTLDAPGDAAGHLVAVPRAGLHRPASTRIRSSTPPCSASPTPRW